MSERYRPGHDAEANVRRVVRDTSPMATSTYDEHDAIVYDEATGDLLGTANEGDWADEMAWQDAARRVMRD
ncbi:hypothetical protein GD416_06705 [Burkholderia sp. BE24]|uniref:hypothetical protein n=1 Tax=unclassified Burkholderia TaxID=2613784 RepID=UPI00117F703A|nr:MULTISPECIES: hypothetical protein [unclassified Burkholderia]MPV56133.1 hypothetical protein [Burkholderia sp. BE24]